MCGDARAGRDHLTNARVVEHGVIAGQAPLDDLAAGRLDRVVIRIDTTGDQRFTQAGDGIDDRAGATARHRVGGEEHARRGGIDHALDHHGQRDRGVVDLVRAPVRHRSLVP